VSSLPFMPLYGRDFRSDTEHLRAREAGAYLLLMMHAWEMPLCRLPDSDRELAHWARVDARTWKKIKPVVMGFWVLKDGYWTQMRLKHEWDKAIARVAALRANARLGGRKNTNKTSVSEKPIGLASGSVLDAQNETNRGLHLTLNTNNPLTPKGEREDDFAFENGKIILRGAGHAHWLKEFGGDVARLHLAMTQASAYVQPNSRRPLEAQINAQLARQLADKRDRDARYAKAANTNKPRAKGEPPADFTFARRTVHDTQDNSDPVTRYPDTSPEFMAEVDRLYQEGFVEDAERARERGWVKLKKTETIGRLAHRIAGHQMEMRKAAKE
jgi:uncharacterized protein YdaU (DUF1376 family)